MPVSIAIRFPAGRYHATPWGHHVNEGLPEWPPSPWRFLRALVATWKRKLAAEPLLERNMAALFSELAGDVPEFFLPTATLGHTRHYMPWFKKGPEDRTLVFDTFVSLATDTDVVVHWPGAHVSDETRQALERVLSHLGYIGRAESWCIARLLAEFDSSRANCRPGSSPPGHESVRVLVADPAKWNDWSYMDSKVVKPDPLWNLLAETADMHQERWSDPPGSKWVTYFRRSDCFAPKPSGPRSRSVVARRYTVARYALDAPVLPLVQDTLPLAEAAHRRLVWLYCNRVASGGMPAHSRVLTGKDGSGQPLKGHGHAFYLPTDEDDDGRIDHLTVIAADGFATADTRALDLFRTLRLGDRDPFRLLLVGLGTEDAFSRSPLFGPSDTWVTATPFVVTRYPKLRGVKRDHPEDYASPRAFAQHVLCQELRRRPDLPEVVAVECEEAIGPRRLRSIQFKRFRKKRNDDGGRRPAGGFRIRFGQPVRGPLCLGHSCHFGLGLFLPAQNKEATMT